MKSDTEGNFLVRLMDISLSPFAIGRQLYQFSATAYEIDDCNLYNIDKYNVFKKGDLKDVVYIGDSHNDCLAAINAGISYYLIERDEDRDLEFPKIYSLMELFK